jgi:cell division protein ZapA
MAQVTLSIGGHSYSVACRDGEEQHLYGLGALVDTKAQQALANVSSASEMRSLLFASLLLADELQEAQKSGAAGNFAPAALPAGSGGESNGVDLMMLDALASKLENLATQLENGAR